MNNDFFDPIIHLTKVAGSVLTDEEKRVRLGFGFGSKEFPAGAFAAASLFLDKHHAWDTTFEVVTGGAEDVLLQWRRNDPLHEHRLLDIAQFAWHAPARWTKGFWSAYAREIIEWVEHGNNRERAVRWENSDPLLRHLPEFAAFVQRFRSVIELPQP